jgi:c-di-GMP-related signal transduction protein
MPSFVANGRRFLGRQAIFDSNSHLYGYELLFRAGPDNQFSGDSEEATNETIDNCLSMVACSSARNLFVNCTHSALVNMSVALLPSQRVVLEVLETVVADEDLLEACRRLRRFGFRIALDDFLPDESRAGLVDIADYVKIDFRSTDAAARQEIYKLFRGKNPVFLAEKVETEDQLATAREEGNTLFQGFYHARPEIILERQIDPNRAIYLQIFAALTESPLNSQKIERLLLSEPSLCFRLLRLANSFLYGIRHPISTIQEALHVVGEDPFRRLISVVLASKLGRTGGQREVEQALERAYFCEAIAPVLRESPAELYMLGMLSVMDQMLNIPMARLVEMVPVDERIRKALLGAPDGMGRALEVCRYEELGGDSQGLPHPDEILSNSGGHYFEALIAAGNALRGLRR